MLQLLVPSKTLSLVVSYCDTRMIKDDIGELLAKLLLVVCVTLSSSN